MYLLRCYILVLLTVCSCSGVKKNKPKKPNFEFLGVTAETKGRSNEGRQSTYVLSNNPTTWDTAQQDCELIFGETGTLLTNLNEEKFKYVQNLMKQREAVGSYWIGGYYDTEATKFVWVKGEEEVSKGDNWSPNPWSPNLRKQRTVVTSMMIEFKDNKAEWNVGTTTELHRYICEAPRSKNTCIQNAYTVFILDNALTVSYRINTIKTLISKFLTAFKPFDINRFGLLLYSDKDPVWVYQLTDKIPLEDLDDAIKYCNRPTDYPYCGKGPGTNIVPAIKEAKQKLLKDSYPGSPLNIIIITRGNDTSNEAAITAAAKSALDDAINLYVIGIWTKKDKRELSSYTAGKSQRAYTISGSTSYDIADVVEEALPAICDS